MKGCRIKNIATFLWMFWKSIQWKTHTQSTTYLTTEIWHFLQTLVILKLFLLLDRSSICFEDGSLLLTLHSSSHEMLLC